MLLLLISKLSSTPIHYQVEFTLKNLLGGNYFGKESALRNIDSFHLNLLLPDQS